MAPIPKSTPRIVLRFLGEEIEKMEYSEKTTASKGVVWLIWIVLISLAAISFMYMTVPANAHQKGCMIDVFGNRFDCKKHTHYRKTRRRKKKHHHHHAPAPPPPPSYGDDYDGEVFAYRRNRQCGEPIRVVGGLKLGLDSAQQNAKEAWAEQARWDLGGKWADWENAARSRSRCAQTRQGKTAGELLHKCEITARPCLPETARGDNR